MSEALDRDIAAWWDRLDEEQRQRLKVAAESELLTTDTVNLLSATRCPLISVSTTFNPPEQGPAEWVPSVRRFVRSAE